MSGYPEGKHDDPADTMDRLVRIGSKYQATAPSVADGDSIYLLVDSAGRVLVAGAVASDAAAAGNPLQVGGVVDDTTPAGAGEGDARSFRATPEGNQIVELYKDNIALSPIAAMPGASELTTALLESATATTTRATVATPASGKKIRIVSLIYGFQGVTAHFVEFYFGTGASITTTPTKSILWERFAADAGNIVLVFPDGAGPVGAADDIVSFRTNNDVSSEAKIVIHYREE